MSLNSNTTLLNQLKTILDSKATGSGGTELPTLTNPGDADKLLEGYQLIDQAGQTVTGTIPSKSASDLTASGKTVTVPAGYYPAAVSKEVATVTQATPTISVSTAGLITASATQSAGYVAAGSKSATKQLTVQAAQTITPGTSDKTISSGRYLTGTQTIKGDANLKAANIVKGASIFGVTGTAETGGSGSSDAVAMSILDRSITSLSDSTVTKVGQYALSYCSQMTSVELPNAKTILTYGFYQCMGLTSVNLPKVTSLATYAFSQCFGLKSVNMPLASSIPSSCFYNCNKMTKADFGAAGSIDGSAFGRCSSLTALILRSETLATLAATSAFTSSAIANGTGYIYVPSALVDSYKAATNWSTYASQIRAIEDYPDITGG